MGTRLNPLLTPKKKNLIEENYGKFDDEPKEMIVKILQKKGKMIMENYEKKSRVNCRVDSEVLVSTSSLPIENLICKFCFKKKIYIYFYFILRLHMELTLLKTSKAAFG